MIIGSDRAARHLAHALHGNRKRFFNPAEDAAHVPVVGEVGECQCVVRIALQDLIDQPEGFKAILARQPLDMPMRTHHALPLAKLGCILAVARAESPLRQFPAR